MAEREGATSRRLGRLVAGHCDAAHRALREGDGQDAHAMRNPLDRHRSLSQPASASRPPAFILALIVACLMPRSAAAQDEDLVLAYEALAMEPLSSEILGGFRGTEIRVRTSFSYTVPHTLVVLRREQGSTWEGGAWLWSPGAESYAPSSPRLATSCEGADFLEPIICVAEPGSAIDWNYVAALAVDSLGVLDLPDPSTLSPPSVVMIDGLYLFAEMAEAGEYRAMTWINHEVRQEAEAGRAYELHRLVDVLTRPTCWNGLPSPWPGRIVRIYGHAPSGPCSE